MLQSRARSFAANVPTFWPMASWLSERSTFTRKGLPSKEESQRRGVHRTYRRPRAARGRSADRGPVPTLMLCASPLHPRGPWERTSRHLWSRTSDCRANSVRTGTTRAY
jgi:hypothetical protein